MTKYKALLTDMDDTLFSSKIAFRKHGVKAIYNTLNSSIKQKDITFDEFKDIYDRSFDAIRRELVGTAAVHNRAIINQRLLEYLDIVFDADLLESMTEAFYEAVYDHISLYEGVEETMARLCESGIKIVGVSDTRTMVQIRKIRKLGISKYFSAVVTSEEAGHEKPHPGIFLLALHKINMRSDEVVYVGDDPEKDIEGAKSLGIYAIQATMRGDKEVMEEGIQKPDCVIKKFKDIYNVIY